MKMEGKWVEATKLNGDTQKRIRKDKERYLQEKCRVLEQHNKKRRTRELYQQIREITGKPKTNTGTIISKTGVEYIEKDNIIRRWKEYTEELYKTDPNVSIAFQEKTYTQEPLVMESKVRKALLEITGNKATGVDELPIELIKATGETATTALTALCQEIWTSNLRPQEWKRSIFLPLPKKGNLRLCSNYRTITMIPHASKILLKIIQGRLATHIEREMSEKQAGFRKGRGTRDQIANMRWIIERAMEYGKTVFMCFIDYSKAFDCVDHSRLWNTLRSMGVPEHLIALIKSLYTNQEAAVRTEYGNTVV